MVQGKDKDIERCMDALANNGVVAFPTDTIYGIASLITSPSAFRRLYTIKGRGQEKPVAVCFATYEQLFDYMPTAPGDLISSLLPGPVTLVLPRGDYIPNHVNPGVDSD